MDQGGITAYSLIKGDGCEDGERSNQSGNQLNEFESMTPSVMIALLRVKSKVVNINLTPAGFLRRQSSSCCYSTLPSPLPPWQSYENGVQALWSYSVFPSGSFEILTGKYISYLIIGGYWRLPSPQRLF